MSDETLNKKPNTDWEKAAEEKQSESERELERLDYEARQRFNREQAALQHETKKDDSEWDELRLF